MNRRKFLAMLAAGGVVTASGIWMPGEKLISIPRRAPMPVITGIDMGVEAGDYIRFSPARMTAREVEILQAAYTRQVDKMFVAVQEDLNGLYRVTARRIYDRKI